MRWNHVPLTIVLSFFGKVFNDATSTVFQNYFGIMVKYKCYE